MLAFQHDEKALPSACGVSMARSARLVLSSRFSCPGLVSMGMETVAILVLQDSNATTYLVFFVPFAVSET